MESSHSTVREQAQRSVRDAVKRKADALRRASPTMVYGLLAGSALAPLAATLGSGGPAVAAALATVTGGVGTNLLSEVVSNALERAHRQTDGEEQETTLADAIAEGVATELGRNDSAARELIAQVTGVMQYLGGFEAALTAATADLQDHLAASLQEAARGNARAIDALAGIRREQRQHRALLEENNDLLRQLARPGGPAPSGTTPVMSAPVPPVFVTVSSPASIRDVPLEERWRAGEEGWIGERRYLLVQDTDGLLREEQDASGERVRRQSFARQTFPSPTPRRAHVWLRQAGHGLTRERDLLRLAREAGGAQGLPAVTHYEATGGTLTLALSWPTGRDGLPCATVRTCFPPGTLDEWRVSLLLAGLGGLAYTLRRLHGLNASHRNLTPEAIIVASDSQFALRDVGLAAVGFRPGEALGDYQAPEQAYGARRLTAGPATDVYQLAAIAHHLISGRVPVASGRVPPLRHHGLPEPVGTVITASLASEPGDRPSPQEFGAILREWR
jgi:hypothetical protein